MARKRRKPIPPERPVPLARADDYLEEDIMDEMLDLYANAVQIIGAAYDFTLEFSANVPIGPVTDPQKPPPIERRNVCRIRMSPQHAKAIIPLLMQNISAYEQQFGKVPLPPDMKELWEQIFPERK